MSTVSEYFSNIIGNDALKLRLSKDISERSLSHAYILEGPRGSGRHTLALQVAAAIECEAAKGLGELSFFESESTAIPCGKCKNCEKILLLDEIAIYRRLVYREAEEYLCKNCLASSLKVEVAEIDKKIEHFKSIGCSLFC